MTILFSALTILALLLIAVFAQVTGMPATSYFVLMFATGAYLLWCARKKRVSAPVKQDS